MNDHNGNYKYLYSFIMPLSVIIAILFVMMNISCKEDKRVSIDDGYYTCSMHPQVIKQGPGDCPICGMKLTFVQTSRKKKKDEQIKHDPEEHTKGHAARKKDAGERKDEYFQFSLAENLLQNARVYTVKSKKEKFTRVSTYSGHIDYNEDPDKLVIISTKYDGWIEKLHVSKEGQKISKSQPLMGVYSQKILAAKEEYITTYQSIKKSYNSLGKDLKGLGNDPTLIATRRKLIYLDVPLSQISILEKKGVAERLTSFRSPISGILIGKSVLQGSYIKPGQELFRIANLKTLWVFIHIFEKDIPFVKRGQSVTIRSIAYPGIAFYGKIDLIYPYLDMKTRDVKVRIVVPNSDYLLKPGMFASVKVRSSIPGRVITIPELAIIYSGEDNYVFVSLGEGDFEMRPIIVIARSDGKAVISSGLKIDELVVANAQFLLDSEASLQEAMQKGRMAGHQH